MVHRRLIASARRSLSAGLIPIAHVGATSALRAWRASAELAPLTIVLSSSGQAQLNVRIFPAYKQRLKAI